VSLNVQHVDNLVLRGRQEKASGVQRPRVEQSLPRLAGKMDRGPASLKQSIRTPLVFTIPPGW
jgi:hypothetical protein